MKIQEILKAKSPTVWTVKSNQTIQEAIYLLSTHRIGALLVTDENYNSVIGVLSERDIVRGCSGNWKPLVNVRVREWMNRQFVTCSPEDEVQEIMAIMTHQRLRHIPVATNGEIEGVVSIGDVVKCFLEDKDLQIQYLKEYAFGSLNEWAD